MVLHGIMAAFSFLLHLRTIYLLFFSSRIGLLDMDASTVFKNLLPNPTANLFFFNLIALVSTAFHWLSASLPVIKQLVQAARRGKNSKTKGFHFDAALSHRDVISMILLGPVTHFNLVLVGRELSMWGASEPAGTVYFG